MAGSHRDRRRYRFYALDPDSSSDPDPAERTASSSSRTTAGSSARPRWITMSAFARTARRTPAAAEGGGGM